MSPVKSADLKSFRRDMTALAAVTRCLADGPGVVTAGARELTPQDAPALVVGAWPDDSPGPPDTTVSQDHSRPASLRNEHLLGLTTPLDPVTTSRVDGAQVLRVASAVVLDA
ncbi:hypothetical protein GA0070603_6108 [Micromonospora chersina]|uniref:Uncharacterized protein n=2 Tax=Micromonospora chersina TaxID=47854 RepID=A0A1C6VZZ2_9ACTN|nr:hypothetical protein GA0070603_6108 [Micromonospora chersina]